MQTVVNQEQEAWSGTNSPASDKAVLGITQQFQKEFETEVMSPQGLNTISPEGVNAMTMLAVDTALKQVTMKPPQIPSPVTSEQAIKEEQELQQEIAEIENPLIADIDYQQAVTAHSSEIDTNIILESIKSEDERIFKEKMKSVILSAESVNKNLPPVPDVTIDKGSDSSLEHYFPEKQITTKEIQGKMSDLFANIRSKFKSYSSSSSSSPAVSNIGLSTPQYKLSPLTEKPSISNLLDDTNALFDEDLNIEENKPSEKLVTVSESFNKSEILDYEEKLSSKKSLKSLVSLEDSEVIKSDMSLNWGDAIQKVDDDNQSITLNLTSVIKILVN